MNRQQKIRAELKALSENAIDAVLLRDRNFARRYCHDTLQNLTVLKEWYFDRATRKTRAEFFACRHIVDVCILAASTKGDEE